MCQELLRQTYKPFKTKTNSDNTSAEQIAVLTNFLCEHANKDFGKHIRLRNSDREFKRARNIFACNKTNENRILFSRSRTRYNRARQKAKYMYQYKVNEGKENIAKTQPENFANRLKKCYKKSNNSNNYMKVEDLYDHFNSLLGQHSDTNEHEQEFESIQDNALDCPTTEGEVRKAVFKQNNAKLAVQMKYQQKY